MINFIKNLLGFGAKETVKEILTPKVEPKKEWTSVDVKIDAVKPVVQKVRAVTVPATPANTKPKARPINEGNRRANVKTLNPNSAKPSAPPAAVPQKKKPKARRK